jgi:hypothetical protein
MMAGRVTARILGEFGASSLLKWLKSPYRPAVPEEVARIDPFCSGLLGRSQAVRQRILIPPFGGSIPPAPAIANALILFGKSSSSNRDF